MSERQGDDVAQVRVFIVDDHSVVREGLKLLLGAGGDTEVVGDAGSSADALAGIARTTPDVVLLDLDLGQETGVSLLPRIAEVAPSAKVLVLTGIRESERHHEALLAGARGLVLKDRPPEVLLKAIRRVEDGELFFERALLESAVRRASGAEAQRDPDAEHIASLTPREREIVTLLGEGMKNEQIARRLSISEKTVRNHLSSVFEKLGVGDRLELLVYAYRHGLVPLGPDQG